MAVYPVHMEEVCKTQMLSVQEAPREITHHTINFVSFPEALRPFLPVLRLVLEGLDAVKPPVNFSKG